MLFFRSWLLTIALGFVSCTTYAQGVHLKTDSDVYEIENRTQYVIEGVRYGNQQFEVLQPKTSIRFPKSAGTLVGGRFRLSQWGEALRDPDKRLARFHMMTAAIYPDGLEPGLAGDPLSSTNVQHLRNYKGPPISCGAKPTGLCLGLLASASKYLPLEHLEYLLEVTAPSMKWPAHVGVYADLPAVGTSIRAAFELWGPAEVAQMSIPAIWLYDRGLSSSVLLHTLGIPEPDGFRTERIARDFNGAYEAIRSAYQSGNELAAAHWSLEAWRLHDSQNFSLSQRRVVCSGFDAGAAHHQSRDQYVAAFAYLMLLGTHCDDTPGQRERFADWFSMQGRQAFAELRLEAARVLFERAYFFESTPKTKAELADTLAELAILRFREGEIQTARKYVEKAVRIGAFRPKVLAAQDADPGGNKRAKIGILIIICFITFFVVRRLRRVWFGDLTPRRRKS